ncbi:hypothetical protein B4100_2291 [Heyndrickxia coagulans]|nr:hypothetical protein B4100_2291 [Heyndrickxia coagulans]
MQTPRSCARQPKSPVCGGCPLFRNRFRLRDAPQAYLWNRFSLS